MKTIAIHNGATRRHTHAFTLIEIALSIAIAILVVLGVLQG